jgi:hypothetical protein
MTQNASVLVQLQDIDTARLRAEEMKVRIKQFFQILSEVNIQWSLSTLEAFVKEHICVWNESGVWTSEFVVVQKRFLWRKPQHGLRFTYFSYQRGLLIFQATINTYPGYIDEHLALCFYSSKPNDIWKIHESLELLLSVLKGYGKLESLIQRVLNEKEMIVQ